MHKAFTNATRLGEQNGKKNWLAKIRRHHRAKYKLAYNGFDIRQTC